MRSIDWEGRSFKELARLAWPITVSMMSYSIMTLADTLLVGRLGAPQLAGVGLAGVAAFTLLCFSFGLLRGVKTLVAQAVGGGRPDEVRAYLGAAIVCAAGLGGITIALGQLLAQALPWIAASSEAGEAARTYLSIRVLGAPMAAGQVALREVRYGEGDARSPMIATIVANVVNVALAAWFIWGLHWGVAGAAWATVIAHTVELVVLMLATGNLEFFEGAVRSCTRRHMAALWRVGVPTGVQFMLEVGSFALLTALVSSLSEVQMAAHQIAIQVIHFSFLPAFAVAEAASVLAGQAVGADKDRLVLRVARESLLLSGIYTGTFTVVFALGAPLIAACFTSNPELAAAAVRLLHVAAVFQVFDAANVVARAVLRGTGDVRFAAVVGVATSWLCTPPLMWLLGYRLGLGAYGGWLGLCAEIVLAALIYWWRLERRGWQPAAVLARQTLSSTPV
jgi:MATE family multidrug resistance protein